MARRSRPSSLESRGRTAHAGPEVAIEVCEGMVPQGETTMSTPRIPSFRTSARAVRIVFGPLALGLLLAVAAAAQPDPQPAAGNDSGSYGYPRMVEGSAPLTQAGSGTSSAAEVNQPIQAGDRLAVPSRGHVEVVLA